VTIGYHISGAFTNAYATTRYNYYGGGGTPNVRLDGDSCIVGGEATGNMYPAYRAYFDTRKSVPSPLDIELTCTYDSVTRAGRLEVKARNATASEVSGQLQVVLCESHIYYVWYNLDSVHHVERNMLPDAGGEAITVPANDSITRTRDFAVDPAWVARNCDLVAFVQNNSTKEIYQGASVGVYQAPAMEYRGCRDAFLQPDTTVNLTVGLVNRGTGPADSLVATLTTHDPYISIMPPLVVFGSAAVGEDVYSQTPFVVEVEQGHPNHALTTMDLVVSGAGGYAESLSFPLYVSTDRGFSDDMERGVNDWTHSGTGDNWHQTEHRSQSPTHSWYPGTEGSYQYTNENDARLVTPWFTSSDSSQLSFDHWYDVEADYDYCMLELNNGSKFWTPLANYTGVGSSWEHEAFSLTDWSGQTLRVAFRFISDPGTVAEGWYVDNFLCEPYQTPVAEPSPGMTWATAALRNPVTARAEFSYAVPPGQAGKLAVYDAGGRLVRVVSDRLSGTGRTAWNLADMNGRRVEAGTYFARLTGGDRAETAKMVVAR
jgi:hypothetical protein